MLFRIYRGALLALKQHFSRKTRLSITSRWLRSASRLVTDAEDMSPVDLAPTIPPTFPTKRPSPSDD